MSMITLTAKHFGSSGYIYVTPNWISNGHWAIARSRVSNAALFTTVEALALVFPKIGQVNIAVKADDSSIAAILAGIPEDAPAWTILRFGYFLEGRKSSQWLTLVSSSDGLVSYLAPDVMVAVELTHGDVMYAAAVDQAMTTKDRTAIVMPFGGVGRPGFETLAPLRSIVHLQDAAELAREAKVSA